MEKKVLLASDVIKTSQSQERDFLKSVIFVILDKLDVVGIDLVYTDFKQHNFYSIECTQDFIRIVRL